MSKRLLITRKAGKGHIISALFEGQTLIEVQAEQEEGSCVDNIYIGKIKNIVNSIHAAFLEIGNGQTVYLSLRDMKNPVYTFRAREHEVTIGDELLVQVIKDKIKTKDPVVSADVMLKGKYLVLLAGTGSLGISGKLGEADKKRLRQLMKPYISNDFGFIVRTNAAPAAQESILSEAALLADTFLHIKNIASKRTCHSLLYKPFAHYISHIRDTYMADLEKIITDDISFYGEIADYLEKYQPEDKGKLMLYEDKLLPLHKLYGLEHKIQQALSPHVWLKSGAYLVIEPTEAMTVIDVNTGKFVTKKTNVQETYYKINEEAAIEIAKQIRLRNLSGIIVVDFINMDVKQDIEHLIHVLHIQLALDPIKTSFIDMTALQLAEITRKKIRKPLHEQITSEMLET